MKVGLTDTGDPDVKAVDSGKSKKKTNVLRLKVGRINNHHFLHSIAMILDDVEDIKFNLTKMSILDFMERKKRSGRILVSGETFSRIITLQELRLSNPLIYARLVAEICGLVARGSEGSIISVR